MIVRKFVVAHTVGNEEKVLKTFPENQKNEAFHYGAEMVKELERGVVVCVLAHIDENNHMIGNQCRVFEVWPFEG